MGRRPVYVDLDVGQGSIAVPGSVGKLLIYLPIQMDFKTISSLRGLPSSRKASKP